MSNDAKVVEATLKLRGQTQDEINGACKLLFTLALNDKHAAKAFLAGPNRFVQAIPKAIPKAQLLQFAQNHDGDLIEKLIQLAGLSDLDLIKEMRAIKDRKDLDPGRTQFAREANPRVQNDQVIINGEPVPIVTRHTRNFNTKLCSVGSARGREDIALDPNDRLLKNLYEDLVWELNKKKLNNDSNPELIFKEIIKLTRRCFPYEGVEDVLKEEENTIQLSKFINAEKGVCRHHTLLNAYFLSRLVEDNRLSGEVIHHKQNLKIGDKQNLKIGDKQNLKIVAHTWNIFHDQKSGKVYSFDSLWGNCYCLSDQPGEFKSKYGENVVSDINIMHFPHDKTQDTKKTDEMLLTKINKVKTKIEETNFTVGDYLFWKGGLVLSPDYDHKRVPHHVHEIYQAIENNDKSTSPLPPDQLWKKIKEIAQNALDKPRYSRHSTTTDFYKSIVNSDEPSIEINKPSASAPRPR